MDHAVKVFRVADQSHHRLRAVTRLAVTKACANRRPESILVIENGVLCGGIPKRLAVGQDRAQFTMTWTRRLTRKHIRESRQRSKNVACTHRLFCGLLCP
jgi:hypothetical protein